MIYLATLLLDIGAVCACAAMFQLFPSMSGPAILVLGVWLALGVMCAIGQTYLTVCDLITKVELYRIQKASMNALSRKSYKSKPRTAKDYNLYTVKRKARPHRI